MEFEGLSIFLIFLHGRFVSSMWPTQCGLSVNPLDRLYTPGSRIVGGKTAQEFSWPWIGAMLQQKPGFFPYHFCAGSLFNEQWFITAGHCLDHLTETEVINRVAIILGKKHLFKAMETGTINGLYKIIQVMKHEHYDFPPGSTNNDVALLKLDRPVRFSPTIFPICLPNDSIQNITVKTLRNPASGRRVCFIAGWGDIRERQAKGSAVVGAGSDDLQQVHIEVYQSTECRHKLRGFRFTGNMLCGGFDGGGQDSCQGDSGGPLVCQATSGPNFGAYELHGIVSWGAGCARPGIPGIYANVFALKSWILNKIRNNW